MHMAKKRTMSEDDVKMEIRDYVIRNYSQLKGDGKTMPDSIHNVLITFQIGNKFNDVGKYTIDIDAYGKVEDANGVKENEHYGTQCVVHVSSNDDDSPSVEIKEKLYFQKR